MSIINWIMKHTHQTNLNQDDVENELDNILLTNLESWENAWDDDANDFIDWLPNNILFKFDNSAKFNAERISTYLGKTCEDDFSIYVKTIDGEQLAIDLSKGLLDSYFDDLNPIHNGESKETVSVLLIDGINAIPSNLLTILKPLIQNHIFKTVEGETMTTITKKYPRYLFMIATVKNTQDYNNMLPAWLLNSCKHVSL